VAVDFLDISVAPLVPGDHPLDTPAGARDREAQVGHASDAAPVRQRRP
jgi:hypothetical protein